MRKYAVLSTLLLALGGALAAYFASAEAARPAQAAPEIILYWGENFTGRWISLMGTTFDLAAYIEETGEKVNWNDEIRSVVVKGGTWRLYQHGRCNTYLDDTALAELDVSTQEAVGGWSALVSATSFGPLELPNPAAGGFWRDISSVELVSPNNLPDWALDFRK